MSHFEPGACLSLWPSEECEWSTWDIWRSSDIVEHAIYISLGLMLLYTLFVLACYLFHCCRHELFDRSPESGTNGLPKKKIFISDFLPKVRTLKGISTAAPFFGLAGTSYGILCALWFPYSGSPQRYVALLFTRIGFAFATTLAGILVALPATILHNFTRTRIESLFSASFSTKSFTGGVHYLRFAETLPLRKRFSGLPPFALLAAPTLACVAALFTPFHPYRIPVGLRVLFPSFPCRPDVADRMIVLQVMANNELFINREQVSKENLPRRLSAIYKTRAERDLYFLAENGASLQTVADAIDNATRIRRPEFNSMEVNVRLVTPQDQADIQKCLDRPWERFVRSRR